MRLVSLPILLTLAIGAVSGAAADSADGGKTWDTNWTMDFKRHEGPPAG
jgi:hypothetical protein